MKCIYCGRETRVVNSRLRKRPNQVWRRRECQACQNIFTSIERPEFTGSLVVKRQNGRVEPFVREKLLLSIYEACRHRKAAVSDSTALTETIIGRLQDRIADAGVAREDIVRTASETLRRFDRAAQVQYLAFHPLKN